MKYHIFQVFRISTPLKEKSSGHFKDVHKLKLLTNFDVVLTSFLGVVINYMLNIELITPPGNDVRFTSKFVRSLRL